MTIDLQSTIEQAWEDRAQLSPASASAEIREAVQATLAGLDAGRLRVAEKIAADWVVHQWVKKAVLLSFRLENNAVMGQGAMQFYDKVPTKFEDYDAKAFADGGFRVVPPAVARKGSFIGKNVVLMPSYVNVGAYVDEGTMVDTWATVGSCAQIGKNVHLSGGVGIGGVLEPLQANPTIIEDNCFIGARSEVVEGVIIEENSVLAMGVFISQSTKIYDRATGEIMYGRVPSGSVVVPGSLPSADGSHSLACAVIVKRVDAQTRSKTSINDLLEGLMSDSAVLQLTKDLISRPSVTPVDRDCQETLARRLQAAGFACENQAFDDVANLWARRGTAQPLLVFRRAHRRGPARSSGTLGQRSIYTHRARRHALWARRRRHEKLDCGLCGGSRGIRGQPPRP